MRVKEIQGAFRSRFPCVINPKYDWQPALIAPFQRKESVEIESFCQWGESTFDRESAQTPRGELVRRIRFWRGIAAWVGPRDPADAVHSNWQGQAHRLPRVGRYRQNIYPVDLQKLARANKAAFIK